MKVFSYFKAKAKVAPFDTASLLKAKSFEIAISALSETMPALMLAEYENVFELGDSLDVATFLCTVEEKLGHRMTDSEVKACASWANTQDVIFNVVLEQYNGPNRSNFAVWARLPSLLRKGLDPQSKQLALSQRDRSV